MRERAVRMVLEQRGEYPLLWAAIESIAPKIGCVPQTLHEWVRKHEIDTGLREGDNLRCQYSHDSSTLSTSSWFRHIATISKIFQKNRKI